MKTRLQEWIIELACLVSPFTVSAQGTAFTCQGRLTDGASPANGSYDLQFYLRDAATLGNPVGATNTLAPVAVSNGLFTVTLDFGSDIFTGADRWLEIGVRTNGSAAGYATLSPRRQITSAPYAVLARQAANLTGTLPATQLTGTLPAALLVGADGGGLSNLDASDLASGTVPDSRLAANVARTTQVWLLGGNTATTAGTHFLGTRDNQPLELKVFGDRGLRLEPGNLGVNLIGGWHGNSVAAGVSGATVAGGGSSIFGPNRVDAFLGVVSGGTGNFVQSNAFGSVIGGGCDNTVRTNAGESVISGGRNNFIGDNSDRATISGGDHNTIAAGTEAATMGGGILNLIQAGARLGTITGGSGNQIQSNAHLATIGGGSFNLIQTSADGGTIAGGQGNIIQPNAFFAAVPGGFSNSAAARSFAAGSNAKANHRGSFVWADAQSEDFASAADDQFSVRASGGVRFSDDTPNLSFGSTKRQMVNLYGTTYGLGVQDNTLYFRSHKRFSWFEDGTHSNTENSPGAGGTSLMTLTAASGLNVSGSVTATAFVPSSDRNLKENFRAVSPGEVLDKVIALPITRWNFKGDRQAEHFGPMAQDFRAAFGLGADDRHIATVDADGVALAAIQGLNQKLGEREADLRRDLERKELEIEALKSRLEKLEQFIQAESARQP